MYDKLVEENLIIQISLLIKESDKTDKDSYCEFMRDIILNTSGIN